MASTLTVPVAFVAVIDAFALVEVVETKPVMLAELTALLELVAKARISAVRTPNNLD